MSSTTVPISGPVARLHWSFGLTALVVAAVVVFDPWLSEILSRSTWQRFHVLLFPYKASVCFAAGVAVVSTALYFSLKARDARGFLIVLMAVAMQTNGIKLLPGLDLATVLPFVVMLYVLAECMLDPSRRIVLGSVTFFGFALLLLDLPYLANLNLYGPVRFIINFISVLKAVLVATALVNLIRHTRDLDLAVRAVMVVATVSALIGITQIALNYFTGLTLTLVTEEHETKPTFLGTVLRASGLTTWTSWLSDFLVLALPFMLFGLLNARRLPVAAVYVFAIAALLGGIFLTFTYAAYAGVAVIFLLFPFVRWPQFSLHFLLALVVAGCLFYAGGGVDWVMERGIYKVTSSSGMVQRHVFIQAALDELTRDPWTGSGFYADEEFSENFFRKRVHNAGLQAWAYLGLPGFLVFITLMLTIFTQLWLLATVRKGRERDWLLALWLGMVAGIVEMFAEPNFSAPVTWFGLGLAFAAIRILNVPAHQRALAAAP